MSANIILKRKLLMREKRLCIPVNSEKKGSTKIAKYIFKRAFETFKSFIEIQRTCFEKNKKNEVICFKCYNLSFVGVSTLRYVTPISFKLLKS